MGAYLIDHPGRLRQYSGRRVSQITGCTVLHTAESVMDTVGPDTGAEAVAEFIRTRSTPGSYHDLCDSDSWLTLVPYEHAAWQDGTGSNPFALSISFACGTHHWRQMNPARRAGFLRQGARAFVNQQAWRRSRGLPTTELRRITKAASDAGASGFIYHGDRDPGRRSDPGKTAPNLFPWDEWIHACRVAMGEDLMAKLDPDDYRNIAAAILGTQVSPETGTVRQTMHDARQIARRTEEKVEKLAARLPTAAGHPGDETGPGSVGD